MDSDVLVKQLLHFLILYCDQQVHNEFTNYHIPTRFDTCNQYLAKLHKHL